MTQTTYNHGSFTSADDTDIYYQSWSAADARGLLVIAHGQGEHGGRYGHVLDAVAPLGLSVWALDHRGHGRSQGRRGHVMRFSEYVDDLKTFVELAKAREPVGKTFLLGHSMGGLIALAYAMTYPDAIDGVCVSSPALGLALEVPRLKAAVGRRLSDLWPSLTLGNGIDPGAVSRDPNEVRAYREDKLVHDRVSARFFTEFTGRMEHARTHASELKTPCLIQVAGDDKLVDAEASRKFYEGVGAGDRTFKEYEGYYHEIFNDLERERPLKDLGDWLAAHL